MNQNVKDFTIQKVNEFMSVPYCCEEAKAAGQAWLDALGTDAEAEKTKALINELEMDIMPIDMLIGFADSEAGVKTFGEETAKNVAAHGRERKAAGAKYCDCEACAPVEAILKRKDELL
ncbi:MAG: molecular chaperone Hsp90 [Clostridium sp.]|nr:molecular chaperone Hsp90 [Clostridium sp.]